MVSIFLLCCIGNLLVLQHTGLQREETEAPLLLGGPRHLTPHWALGCRGLVRDPLVPRVQGVGFRDGPPRVQGGVPAFIAPLQIFTMMQSIQISLLSRAWGCARPAAPRAPLGFNWRLRTWLVRGCVKFLAGLPRRRIEKLVLNQCPAYYMPAATDV